MLKLNLFYFFRFDHIQNLQSATQDRTLKNFGISGKNQYCDHDPWTGPGIIFQIGKFLHLSHLLEGKRFVSQNGRIVLIFLNRSDITSYHSDIVSYRSDIFEKSLNPRFE